VAMRSGPPRIAAHHGQYWQLLDHPDLPEPCGCRNPVTLYDLGILADQATESVAP
jgi:hypothetical protein